MSHLLKPVAGTITQKYLADHQAIDWGAPRGTKVVAADDGIVASAGPAGAYGNRVVLGHDSVTTTLYAHLDQILVQPGQTVRRGQVIGTVGNTGHTISLGGGGYHLHFELEISGQKVNPLDHGLGVLSPVADVAATTASIMPVSKIGDIWEDVTKAVPRWITAAVMFSIGVATTILGIQQIFKPQQEVVSAAAEDPSGVATKVAKAVLLKKVG